MLTGAIAPVSSGPALWERAILAKYALSWPRHLELHVHEVSQDVPSLRVSVSARYRPAKALSLQRCTERLRRASPALPAAVLHAAAQCCEPTRPLLTPEVVVRGHLHDLAFGEAWEHEQGAHFFTSDIPLARQHQLLMNDGYVSPAQARTFYDHRFSRRDASLSSLSPQAPRWSRAVLAQLDQLRTDASHLSRTLWQDGLLLRCRRDATCFSASALTRTSTRDGMAILAEQLHDRLNEVGTPLLLYRMYTLEFTSLQELGRNLRAICALDHLARQALSLLRTLEASSC
ncbi:hypothetical protein GCM10008957_32420 [Deinococcus ruber]|uniref:Uncharacterized protein n=2 Tax=Deinococcus ruber TaxID=1848197 RepID=A0A918CBU3_9DEIO|nr:hypothetical protein GCM10008957_32420 [Deinococcus ruber]